MRKIYCLNAAILLLLAAMSDEMASQIVTSANSLPSCSEKVPKVSVHTAVWHIDSKTFIRNLTADKFRLNVRKRLPFDFTCFSEPDAPYTIGMVVDLSVSMPDGALRLYAEGFREFVKAGHDENMYFAIGFRTKSFVMLPPTKSRSEVDTFITKVAKENSSGDSGVNDAVQTAIDMMPADNPGRRIIILASDGQDNSSKRLSESKIIKALRNAGIRVFPVTVQRYSDLITSEVGRGNERLFYLSHETGGRWLGGNFQTGLTRQLLQLSAMLRGEYTLGFTPEKVEEKWQELEYSVRVPKEFQRIQTTGAYRFYY